MYCEGCGAVIVSTAFELLNSLKAIVTDNISCIKLDNDIEVNENANMFWKDINYSNYSSAFVLDGNGKTISGLKTALFGAMQQVRLTVKDLTVKDSYVAVDDAYAVQFGMSHPNAAVFGYETYSTPTNTSMYSFNNVHILNAYVESSNYAAGFLSYTVNGRGSISIKDCSFDGEVKTTAGGSVGAIAGHTHADVDVDGFVISEESVISNDEDRGNSLRKVGALIGTLAGGHNISSSGYIDDPDLSVKNTVNKGVVYYRSGTAEKNLGLREYPEIIGRNTQTEENPTSDIIVYSYTSGNYVDLAN